MKEAVWERVEAPSLNKKGGLRCKLSNAWVHLLRNILRDCLKLVRTLEKTARKIAVKLNILRRLSCDEVRRFRTKRYYLKKIFMSSKRFKTFLYIYILD